MPDLAKVTEKIINERRRNNLSPLPVIYEDNHLLVVEKYPFVLSQPDGSKKTDALTLGKEYIRLESIKANRPKSGGIYLTPCHRLDYTVGGVLLLAKTDKAAGRMQKNGNGAFISKKYVAVSERNTQAWELLQNKLAEVKIDEDIYYVLTGYAAKDSKQMKAVVRLNEAQGYKPVSLLLRLLVDTPTAYIWQIILQTGRFHQIRAQLALANLPLLGDYKYNQRDKGEFSGPLLWSYQLEIKHPVKPETMCFNSYPKELNFGKYAQIVCNALYPGNMPRK